jgi:hypothetical protein
MQVKLQCTIVLRRDRVTEPRVWAYAVPPIRTSAEATTPRGGRIPASQDLQAALQAAADRTRESAWTSVVFRVEQLDDARGRRRSNEPRDALLDLAFGVDDVADAAALRLANRLAGAMDYRSQANLLILLGNRADAIGSTRVWTFPRDDAFRFDAAAEPTVELLADVFSRTSGLRKAARYDGEDHDASFIGGFALDYQTGSNNIDVAEYWIGRFLGCSLGVTPTAGTQLVARALRKLDETLTNPAQRQTLTMAAVGLRHSPRTNWTLTDIASSFLPLGLREALVAAADKPDMVESPFALDHVLFDSLVATRVFSLESGVVVTSPISEVGTANDPTKPVVISGDRLRCEGIVAKEVLRGRRRGSAA